MFKRILIILTLLLLLVPSIGYCGKHYILFAYDGTTGGTEGKLDEIDLCNADGNGYDIQNKDAAIVWSQTGFEFIFYIMDIDSAVTELDPFVVAPDECDGSPYAGDARWIIAAPGGSFSVTDSSGINVTTEQARRGVIVYESGNQQTVLAPAVADDMIICAFATGADGSAEIYLDVNGSDHIDFEGTSADNGEYLHNTSSEKDDYICILGQGANTWKVWGYRGTWAEQTP